MCVYTHVHTFLYIHMSVYIYIHIYVYVHMYVYILHTHMWKSQTKQMGKKQAEQILWGPEV